MEKLGGSYTAGGNVKECNHFEKWFDSSSKVQHGLNIGSSNSTATHVLKRNENIWSFTNWYTKGHSNIIHISQKVETIHQLISE